MSNILRRPMFRRGGPINSRGTGLTSGLVPKRGRVDGPGGYSGSIDEAIKFEETVRERIPYQPQNQLSLGDWLRIGGTGMQIMGAPSEGSGLSGALASASGPLANLGIGLGQSIDSRNIANRKAYEDKIGRITESATDIEREKIKANKLYAKAQDAQKIGQIMDKRIATLENKLKVPGANTAELRQQIDSLKKQKENMQLSALQGTGSIIDFRRNFILGMLRVVDDASELAELQASLAKMFSKQQLEEIFGNVNLNVSETIEKKPALPKATGGRVGMYGGGPILEDESITEDIISERVQEPEQEDPKAPMRLSYEELRARLPQSIGDQIVRLLAENYEALGDFAEIQTQADVDNFNLKYQVNLVLPQEA
tara:strand:+ start:968 stop:2074 length:1107 start_codon:yes stop_codon:yes gene_type:complete